MDNKINVKNLYTAPNETNKTERKGNSELGKDAFLHLLVAQLKYQDPLNPSTDTEFVSQLANFSQLEQLQNLSKATTNSQALTLVGKTVVIKVEDISGKVNYIQGVVDYINLSGGKTQLSINDNLYDIGQLESVIDDFYLLEKGLPTVDKKYNLNYDHDNPKDLTFEVNFGSGDTIADNVAVIIGDKVISAEHINVNGKTITIAKDALKNIKAGDYNITIAFNDPLYTMVKDKITVSIKGEPLEDNQDINDESQIEDDNEE